MARLPDKPSELIRLAVADLKRSEADPCYRIEFGTWHDVTPSKICVVCLAGAVMAFSLDVPQLTTTSPQHFRPDIRAKLSALDWGRRSLMQHEMFSCLGLGPDRSFDRIITPYGMDPLEFKNEMLKLADDLEKAEL